MFARGDAIQAIFKAKDVGFNIDIALSSSVARPPPAAAAAGIVLGTHIRTKVWRGAGSSAAACGYGMADASATSMSQQVAAHKERTGPTADGWSSIAKVARIPVKAAAAAATMLGASMRAFAHAVSSPTKAPALPKCTCGGDAKGKSARESRKLHGGDGRGGRVTHNPSCPKGTAQRARSKKRKLEKTARRTPPSPRTAQGGGGSFKKDGFVRV